MLGKSNHNSEQDKLTLSLIEQLRKVHLVLTHPDDIETNVSDKFLFNRLIILFY
jgi:hypothetical protein